MRTNIHFHWKEHDHASGRHMLSRSRHALTTLVIRQSGSYYVVTRSLVRPLRATLLLRKF